MVRPWLSLNGTAGMFVLLRRSPTVKFLFCIAPTLLVMIVISILWIQGYAVIDTDQSTGKPPARQRVTTHEMQHLQPETSRLGCG